MSRELVQSVRQHLREALPLRQAIKYSRGWNRERYDKAFGGKYRLFIPLDHLQRIDLSVASYDVAIPLEIRDALRETDYDYLLQDEYLQGIITKDHRTFKLGRVLQKLDPTGRLLGIFNGDPQRLGTKLKSQDLMLVISRHPYDIAGMSTDRGWSSCMELPNPKNRGGGCNHTYVSKDIKLGTLIAYLTKKNDTNLQHPIGRVLIKPYFTSSEKKFTLVVSGNVYGVMPENVRAEVERWVNENQEALSTAKSSPFSSFYPHVDLYTDSDDPDVVSPDTATIRHAISTIRTDNIEEFKKFENLDYNDEISDPFNGDTETPAEMAAEAGAWKILEYLIQQPNLQPFSIAEANLDHCPQSVIDLIVKKNLYVSDEIVLRSTSPILIKTLAKHNPLHPALPRSLFDAILRYCKQGDEYQNDLDTITQLLKAGVPLEYSQTLEIRKPTVPRKRIVSKYIYDIVATKSFPEVVGLRISLGDLRSLLLLLQKHGGKRHHGEPRVIVQKIT